MVQKGSRIISSRGTYTIGDFIGRGTFSTVYESLFQEKEHQTKMAVKFFFSQNDPKSIERDIEIGCDRRLDSEYTVVYKDVFCTMQEEFRCVSMALMKSSLRKYIDSIPNKYLNDEDIKLKISQIILGVAVLHNNRVTHFDLKPDNVLIDEKGYIKLADYGESRIFVQDVKATYSKNIGTLMYRAPEFLDERENIKYSFECDIWSVAMILYEMMEGDYPHPCNFQKLVQELKNGKVKPLTKKRPPELVSLYNSMLKINPSSRPNALELLSDSLIYQTIITHKLPIPLCLQDYWKMLEKMKQMESKIEQIGLEGEEKRGREREKKRIRSKFKGEVFKTKKHGEEKIE